MTVGRISFRAADSVFQKGIKFESDSYFLLSWAKNSFTDKGFCTFSDVIKPVREQFLLAAAAQNLKRLVRFLSQPTRPVLEATA
jgi:hypothetical protein